MARSNDSNLYHSATATSSAPFTLKGGKYAVSELATFAMSDTLSLEYLGPDGSTYVSVGSALVFAATGGYVVIDLPPGQYKWVLGSTHVTAIYAAVVRIPND